MNKRKEGNLKMFCANYRSVIANTLVINVTVLHEGTLLEKDNAEAKCFSGLSWTVARYLFADFWFWNCINVNGTKATLGLNQHSCALTISSSLLCFYTCVLQQWLQSLKSRCIFHNASKWCCIFRFANNNNNNNRKKSKNSTQTSWCYFKTSQLTVTQEKKTLFEG